MTLVPESSSIDSFSDGEITIKVEAYNCRICSLKSPIYIIFLIQCIVIHYTHIYVVSFSLWRILWVKKNAPFVLRKR